MGFVEIILLVVFFLCIFVVFPVLFGGAIYLPTKKKTSQKMIELLQIKPGEKALDIGSGDGRLVIAMARSGAIAHGYEINPFLVIISRFNIYNAGLKNKAFVHWKNFWLEDFSGFDIVTLFGIDFAMPKLEEKLKKELKNDARIASFAFAFPNWQYDKKEYGIFFYKK